MESLPEGGELFIGFVFGIHQIVIDRCDCVNDFVEFEVNDQGIVI